MFGKPRTEEASFITRPIGVGTRGVKNEKPFRLTGEGGGEEHALSFVNTELSRLKDFRWFVDDTSWLKLETISIERLAID